MKCITHVTKMGDENSPDPYTVTPAIPYTAMKQRLSRYNKGVYITMQGGYSTKPGGTGKLLRDPVDHLPVDGIP